MYEVFYSLTAEPFRLSPDHKFCYEHKGYARARAYMAYAFKRAEGFVMITGRPGTGKTTLIGELVESLAKDNVSTANLVCTQLQADDLLKTVAYSFGVGAEGVDKAALLQRLSVLFHSWHRDGRRALLIVDEAQDLSLSAMEELRLLTNIQQDGQPLVQIFLLGQPELRELVLSPEMEQVHQRIVAASHLEGLEEDEVEAYVMHRLKMVGWRGDPAISKAIFPLLHKFSEGVPRRINLICSRLFLHGGVEERHSIEVGDVRVVITELQAENLAAGRRLSDDDFIVAGPTGWAEVPQAQAPEPPAPAEPAPASPPRPEEGDSSGAPPRAAVRLRAVGGPVQESPSPEHVPAVDQMPAADGDTENSKELVTPLSPDYRGGPEARVIPLAEPEVRPAYKPEPVQKPGTEPVPELAQPQTHAGATPVTAGGRERTQASRPVSPVAPERRRGSRSLAVALTFLLLLALAVLGLYLPSVLFEQDELWADPWQLPPREEFVPYDQAYGESHAENSAGEVNAGTTMVATEPVSPVPSSEADASAAGASATDERIVGQPEPEAAGSAPSAEELTPADQALVTPGQDVVAPSESLSVEAAEPDPLAQATGDLVLLVSFPFDSIDLSDRAREVLDEVAGVMLRDASSSATIVGFADHQGDGTYNMQLSRDRAVAVESYLVGRGVPVRRLTVEGRGAAQASDTITPVGAAAGDETRRIVQIKISRGGA